jgi:F-type H+-transporting ATPase subunit gamma
MDSPEALDARRRSIERIVPILDAVRSIAELAWRRAEEAFAPLHRYREEVERVLAPLVRSLDRRARAEILGGRAAALPTAVLFVGSERGLCGAFNERLVRYGLRRVRALEAEGRAVHCLCLGARARRLLEAAGRPLLYAKPLASLSLPAYVDVQGVALDLVQLVERRAAGRLLVVHNAPTRRFQYAPSTSTLFPPEIDGDGARPPRVALEPADDLRGLLTHLLTERLLVELTRVVIESALSEQLARVYTMRLAADNARALVGRLALEYNVARRNAITGALLEVVAGYAATVGSGVVAEDDRRHDRDHGGLP